MILDRYIFKELFKSQFVVLLVLISIFAAQSLIRLVTDAASGDMPAGLIIKFLLFSLPEFLGLLLPLTLYVSIIITLGRICSDSEMVVMRAVGFSPKRIMTVALMLGVVSACCAGYVSLVLTPKSALAMQELEVQAAKNPEFLPIDSGRFVSFGKYNIYVEQVEGGTANDKQVENVYVIDSESPASLSITVASKGHIVVDDEGVRWLVLNDGRRYENPEDGTYRIGNFSQFKAPLSGNITDANAKGSKLNTLSSWELWRSNDIKAQVELQWRLAPVFAVLVMCMVAVPLSMVNPRQGRFTRLMPAIIIYVAYYLFLLSLRNMVYTGAIPLFPGLYLVPICFFLLVAIPLNMPKTYIKQKISDKKAARNKAQFENKSINQPAVSVTQEDEVAIEKDAQAEKLSKLNQKKSALSQQATSKSEAKGYSVDKKNQGFDSDLKRQVKLNGQGEFKHGLDQDLGSLQLDKDKLQELQIESGTERSKQAQILQRKGEQASLDSRKSQQDGE